MTVSAFPDVEEKQEVWRISVIADVAKRKPGGASATLALEEVEPPSCPGVRGSLRPRVGPWGH